MKIGEEEILYEDNHLLIVNKPAGLLAQGDLTGDPSLIDVAGDFLREKYSKPGKIFVGLPHRIDRPVSGAIILCKTSKSLSRVSSAFKNNEVKKSYWAIVTRRPPAQSERLVHWLVKDKNINKVHAYTRETARAKKSELEYEILAEQDNRYLILVRPVTGRSHQIRAQLSRNDIPIAGDVKYGGDPAQENIRQIYLHSRSLDFPHPVKDIRIMITAPLPGSGLWKLFANLEEIDQ
jgi:23S rRNA pseudouridine1911/1915/1917 synthase